LVEAAWIGAGAALAGVLLSTWTESRRVRRAVEESTKQRAHQLALRDRGLREEHRARLHADRRDAYAEFYRCYRRLVAAGDWLGRAMLHPGEREAICAALELDR
jgi:hypothetical protein